MAQIVIIGTGFSGLSTALEMKSAVGSAHSVVVISSSSTFELTTSCPWLAVGWRLREDIGFSIESVLSHQQIHFIQQAVDEIQPKHNRLVLSSGETIEYNFLVLATGVKPEPLEQNSQFDSVKIHGINNFDTSESTYKSYARLVNKPGPVVVYAAPHTQQLIAAYETVFILDYDLRRRRIRDRIPITFVTAEPHIGHFGIEGIADSKLLLEEALLERNIHWRCQSTIEKVDDQSIYISNLGSTRENHSKPVACHFPVFINSDMGQKINGVSSEFYTHHDLVSVDIHQRSKQHSNIYAVGHCAAIDELETPNSQISPQKNSYLIESMVNTAVRNIVCSLEGKPESAKTKLNAIIMIDLGESGAVFTALPQNRPRHFSQAGIAPWVHFAKTSYERYVLDKLKSRYADPITKKRVLNFP